MLPIPGILRDGLRMPVQSFEMNESDDELFTELTFDSTLIPGVKSWTSSSSATLVGDESITNSEPIENTAEHRHRLTEKDSSNSSDSEPTSNNFVALRPLYTTVSRSDSEKGPQPASDVKLGLRSRKGHRKSRQGCFNCKRRKIKCQETLPACDNCLRKELLCKYPAARAPSLLHVVSDDIGSPIAPVQLQTTPMFSLLDMRFFHHFIFHAYPHLPIGNDDVWVHRVPAIAYEYEYLMHAILGLAASHLTVTSETDYSSLALSHRLKAIKGFNEALSKTPRTGSDGDALLAACYALTFQTANMKDGMSEFLTMVRGCGLVSFQLASDGVNISFSISPARHLEYMHSRLGDLPMVDADLYHGAVASVRATKSLCAGLECLVAFQQVMQDCIETFGADSRAGYYKFYAIYHTLGKMEQIQFRQFSNHGNHVSFVLLAHFVACEIMIAPVLGREWEGRVIATPMEGTLQWLLSMRDGIPIHLRSYLDWPVSMASIIKAELRGEHPARPWLKAFFKGGLV